MSSPTKAAANAANARLSTGPKTDAGKAASSRNSTTHGLSAKQPVIQPGEHEAFDALRQALRDELSPAGALETGVFHQLLHAAWKQQCIGRMEQQLFQGGLEAVQNEQTAQTLDRLNRYAAAEDRAYYRALKEFRVLQTGRTMRITIDPEVVSQVPPLADIASVLKQQQTITRADQKRIDQELEAFIDAPMPDVDLSEIRGKYLKKAEEA